MGKRANRVPVILDTQGIRTLPPEEIQAILRGADNLIGRGGRGMLAKVLKGSKDKKLLEYGLDDCPVYGYFKEQSIEDITAKIDWLIRNDYLRIEYEGRLPMLVFAPRGWQITKNTRVDEFIRQFDDMWRRAPSLT